MIALEIHPEVHVREQFQQPQYSTCRECHRSFHPKTEDQLGVQLCDGCFDALLHPQEVVPTVHVKVLPRRSSGL